MHWGSGIAPKTPSGGHASLGMMQQLQRFTLTIKGDLNVDMDLLRNQCSIMFFSMSEFAILSPCGFDYLHKL